MREGGGRESNQAGKAEHILFSNESFSEVHVCLKFWEMLQLYQYLVNTTTIIRVQPAVYNTYHTVHGSSGSDGN